MIKIPNNKIPVSDLVSCSNGDVRVLTIPKCIVNELLVNTGELNKKFIFYNLNDDEDIPYKYSACYSWNGNEILYENLSYFMRGVDRVYSNDTCDNSDYYLIIKNK